MGICSESNLISRIGILAHALPHMHKYNAGTTLPDNEQNNYDSMKNKNTTITIL